MRGTDPRALARSGRRSTTKEVTSMSIGSTVNIGAKPVPVNLSEVAISKVAELLADEAGGEELFLRVSVKAGGCSGFSYDMYFDSEETSDDVVTKFGTVRVVVDRDSAEKLMGSSLDYSDGLNDAGFHITNPNASRTCGCGSSFS
jgi:iron-sulfur cluster assembly protein/iron-sulfur cluster insertion protein